MFACNAAFFGFNETSSLPFSVESRRVCNCRLVGDCLHELEYQWVDGASCSAVEVATLGDESREEQQHEFMVDLGPCRDISLAMCHQGRVYLETRNKIIDESRKLCFGGTMSE